MKENLRHRAETLLRENVEQTPTLPTEDVKSLVHELQVYQMELEIQNEDLRGAQIELAAARDAASELYDFAPSGYLTLDGESRILESNFAAASMLGVERARLAGRQFLEFVDNGDRADWSRYFAKVSRRNDTQATELVLRGGDGLIVVRLECRVAPGRAPEPARYLLVLIDVTAHRRAESALHDLNQQLELRVADRTSALSMLCDVGEMANGAASMDEAITYVLQRVSRYDGWSIGHAWLPAAEDPDELIPGFAWYEEAPPRFEKFRAHMLGVRARRGEGLVGRVYATGQPECSDDIGRHLSEYTASLSAAIGIQTVCAFPIQARDRVAGVLEFYSEHQLDQRERMEESMASVGTLLGRVIERTAAEEAQRDSEARTRAIVDAAADAIITCDAGGTIQLFNLAAERLFGYRAAEAVGQPVGILIPPSYTEIHNQMHGGDSSNGIDLFRGIDRDVMARRKGGALLPVRVSVSELQTDSERLYIAVVNDLTERRALESAVAETMAAQQRDLGQDLHDNLGQLMAGIEMSAAAIRRGIERDMPTDIEQANALVEMVMEGQRILGNLIAGLRPVHVPRDRLGAALQQIREHIMKRYGIACTLHAPADLVAPDSRTATQLFYIAQEAALNAAQHAEANTVSLRISKHSGALYLQVEDDGVGIGDELVSSPRNGLKIMRHRAAQIGGQLTIAGRAEGGTVVFLVVPIE